MPATPVEPPVLRTDCALGAARFRLWEHAGGAPLTSRPSAHPDVEIAFIESGSIDYTVGSKQIHASPGTIVVIPTWVEHVTRFEQPVRGIALHVDPELVAEVAEAGGTSSGAATLDCGLAEPGSIPALVALLEREIRSTGAGWRLAADALLEAIVVQMLRAPPIATGRVGARDARIAAALETIQTRYAEPLTVDDLARAAGMSRFHFSRLFRQEVGEAPYQHLLRIRIARAAELLRSRRRSVTEAALEVGFQDLGRFSRSFRAQIGCLPSAMGTGARSSARQR